MKRSGEVLPRLSGFLSGRVNPRGVPRLVKSVGRPSLVSRARACVPLSTTFVHSRRARRRRICATRRRGSGPPTARPTPNHREARRHTTRTACSAALRQSSRGPEKGPRSPVVPNSTRSHAYPTIPCHPRADPARSRGGPRWSSLVLAPCRRPSADVLARARACTERPQPALARAFGADWCPSRTVQRTRALRATHALAQSSAQRQRERARPPGLLLARRARAIPLSLSVFAGRVLQLKDMDSTRRTRCCGHRRSCPHARNGAMVGSANAQDHVCARHARTGAQAGEAMPKTALGVARARLQPTGTAARA